MRSIAMLQEMGLTVWQLRKPERVNAHPEINIPENCRLLFVAPEFPENDELELLVKIALSMGVSAEEVYYLTSEQLQLLDTPQEIAWLWFCGEEKCAHSLICNRQIASHRLSALKENPLFKKQLWQQIKQYKEV